MTRSRAPKLTGFSFREVVYDTLRLAIVNGALVSGSRLPEEELAQELGVSRTPVREALQRLLAVGLARRETGRGLIVRHFSRKEIQDIYYVRLQLEPAAAELSAGRATPAVLDALGLLLDRMASIVGPGGGMSYHQAHRQFHASIARISQNEILTAQIETCLDIADTIWLATAPGPTRYATADRSHRSILAAIAARKPKLARHAMTEHLEHSLNLILDHIPPTMPHERSLRAVMESITASGSQDQGLLGVKAQTTGETRGQRIESHKGVRD